MAEKFVGLVPGRHLFYEHPSDGSLCAIVAKVCDAETGRVNVALLLPTGMWINYRDVMPCASVTGEVPYEGFSGFQHHRWRWMFEGQAASVRLAAPVPGDPGYVPAATGEPAEMGGEGEKPKP